MRLSRLIICDCTRVQEEKSGLFDTGSIWTLQWLVNFLCQASFAPPGFWQGLWWQHKIVIPKYLMKLIYLDLIKMRIKLQFLLNLIFIFNYYCYYSFSFLFSFHFILFFNTICGLVKNSMHLWHGWWRIILILVANSWWRCMYHLYLKAFLLQSAHTGHD